MTEGPTLDELRAFLAVADTGSFAAAATRLGRDPSILTRRVRSLESRLGLRLLARTTRAVALTEAGVLYRQRVQGLVDELDAASREAADLASTPRGLLRVAVPLAFGRRWIAPMLPAFSQRYPDIRLDVRFADQYVDLVAEGFDMAIRVGRLPDSTYIARKVAGFQSLLVASPDYLARHGTPQQPEDLTRHACLGFTGHVNWPNWTLRSETARYTFKPEGPMMSDSTDALVIAACQGLGIMMAPTWLIASELRDGRLQQVLPAWLAARHGGIHVLHPPGRIVTAKARVFAEAVEQHLATGSETAKV